MNGDLYFDGKKYISSSRAAKISGYANDYIGQLCRDGKLDCRMVGRSWYVGLESLIKHKSTYLTGTRSRGPRDTKTLIAEAAKVTPVSKPKIEQEGLPNYTVGVSSVSVSSTPSEPGAVVIPIRKAPQVSYPVFAGPEFTSHNTAEAGAVLAPVEFENVVIPAVSEVMSRKSWMQTARIASAVVALFFAVMGFRFGLLVNPVSQSVYATAWNNTSAELPASVWSAVADRFAPVVATISDVLRNWLIDSRQTIFVLSGGTNSPAPTNTQPVTQTDTTSQPQQGMVVVPVTPATDQQAVVQRVRNTFSDQVNVVPKGSDNGVITPVFKKSKSDDYLYVMVPINN